jgi:hypothetical protein
MVYLLALFGAIFLAVGILLGIYGITLGAVAVGVLGFALLAFSLFVLADTVKKTS